MDTIKEKVAYLKGLSEGLGINNSTNEGKLLLAIVDVLDDMAEEVDVLDESYGDLEEYVETIDEDLSDLENEVYDEDDYEDDGYIEMECPNCHETVFIDRDMFEDEDQEEVICPNCSKPIAIECGCDCGCGDDCDCE